MHPDTPAVQLAGKCFKQTPTEVEKPIGCQDDFRLYTLYNKHSCATCSERDSEKSFESQGKSREIPQKPHTYSLCTNWQYCRITKTCCFGYLFGRSHHSSRTDSNEIVLSGPKNVVMVKFMLTNQIQSDLQSFRKVNIVTTRVLTVFMLAYKRTIKDKRNKDGINSRCMYMCGLYGHRFSVLSCKTSGKSVCASLSFRVRVCFPRSLTVDISVLLYIVTNSTKIVTNRTEYVKT
ncbi:hypothetical protein KUTeg_023975 [Tegillarca granosa]|uniref:Uncharacterized protein n=1 Tax=Tegillarca granosa TaxID=220873 RepID=A0ABQ9DWL6_TEGGR|nr:hypothetical protein KUTeg_023975 [Tegillarca granosa]